MTASEYLRHTRKQRFEELFELLRIPSISTQSEYTGDVLACGKWLKAHLSQIGFRSQLLPTDGNPIVYAEYVTEKTLPTVLYYGHYDVQPPEPIGVWKSPPFEPVRRQDCVYGRGAADNKGQIFAHIKGLEAVLRATGTLPINVKCIVEGEEEITPSNLPQFLKKHRKMLEADVCVISDTAQFDKSTPAIVTGLRGVAVAEVILHGPKQDLHSGAYGGAVANPINILCNLISKLHDRAGRIAIPGFYRNVRSISKVERQRFQDLPYQEREYLEETGAPALHGEKGYSTYERTWARPALDINGITGGYQGEGQKPIIPAWASAKMTIRLVADQEPDDVLYKLEKHLKQIAPRSVNIELRKYGGTRAVSIPTRCPWLDAARRAVDRGFGRTPVYIKEGASIPAVGDIKSILELDSLLIGFCQNDDNAHSPNERIRIRDFERGCKTAAILPDELFRIKAGRA